MKSKVDDLKGIQFDADLDGEGAHFKMPCLGEHNARNALAALAVGGYLGLSVSGMKKALSKFQTSSKRMEIVPFPKKISVINDCYNANPDSTEASLRLLQQAARKRRRVAILGEMLELGPQASRYHREVGASAAKLGVNLLFAVGPHAEDLIRGARRQGLSKKSTFVVDGTETSLSLISSLVRAGDLILVKGSRGMKMEKITEGLRGRIS
jgi:UDP-N-acetylmuramoyl-tripeptide--D-alanyl-D-alanine ligase